MLEDALEITDQVFADQVEYHAKLSQHELRRVAESGDVLIEAYAPLSGSAGDLVDEEVLANIAEAHHASPGQIALAWLAHQDRVVALPRSTDPDRRRENLASLEIDLSDEEKASIDELSEQRQRNFSPSFAPDWRD
jgi:diketogulonate reductase-like aldo/keto reductase